MVERHGTLRPPKKVGDFVSMEPGIHDIADIDFTPIMNKDSTNMVPSDWRKIARTIFSLRDKNYKGFVVAHGTDTMHFSASAVAFALGRNLSFPVIFTGAQTAPQVRHGDARTNLLRACLVATHNIAEVCICFGDFVFRGCRAQKKSERKFDAFESPAYPPVAYITEAIEVQPFAASRTRESSQGDIDLRAEFAEGVMPVTLIPGLEPDLVMSNLESPLCNGLILQSFGAGNVPNKGMYSFIKLIKRAKKLNKPVIVTSQFAAGATDATHYETGVAAVKAGAISTGNMTNAAAVAKFRWVLADVLGKIRRNELRESEKLKAVEDGIHDDYVGELDMTKPANKQAE